MRNAQPNFLPVLMRKHRGHVHVSSILSRIVRTRMHRGELSRINAGIAISRVHTRRRGISSPEGGISRLAIGGGTRSRDGQGVWGGNTEVAIGVAMSHVRNALTITTIRINTTTGVCRLRLLNFVAGAKIGAKSDGEGTLMLAVLSATLHGAQHACCLAGGFNPINEGLWMVLVGIWRGGEGDALR
jgi:hypothetical protein